MKNEIIRVNQVKKCILRLEFFPMCYQKGKQEKQG
jgi:hypothetical protein